MRWRWRLPRRHPELQRVDENGIQDDVEQGSGQEHTHGGFCRALAGDDVVHCDVKDVEDG